MQTLLKFRNHGDYFLFLCNVDIAPELCVLTPKFNAVCLVWFSCHGSCLQPFRKNDYCFTMLEGYFGRTSIAAPLYISPNLCVFSLTGFPSLEIMMADIRKKLVVVGDGACGKTCLLM